MSDASPYPLNRRLPDDVALGGGNFVTGYLRYPAFGWSWLGGRAWRFAIPIVPFSMVSGFGYALISGSAQIGLTATALALLSIMAVCFFGPLLATLVRSLRMPLARERWLVVFAVFAGMGLAYLVDDAVNKYLIVHLKDSQITRGLVVQPELTGAQKTMARALKVMMTVGYFGICGGGLALRAYFVEQRRWRESEQRRAMTELRAQKEQADLRLGVLQAQVEPHFLFNTLASVRALVRQDPAQAEATLDALVDYLRATIPRLRDGEQALHSTLGQQLDLCASYLELMRLRTGGRLQYAIEAGPDLRALPFPPLLLISLVENAVKHGIEPKRGPGRIVISAAREADALAVAVTDDGVGLQPGVGGGLGLANVRAQLETRYGGRAAFALTSAPASGARAELRIPLEGAQAGAAPSAGVAA
jgi:hypothetical protein